MPEKEPKPELSLKEKERRWSLLREKLMEAGLSALIVYGGTQLGVPLHYLTKVWGSRMNTVIFPVDWRTNSVNPQQHQRDRRVTGQTGLLAARE